MWTCHWGEPNCIWPLAEQFKAEWTLSVSSWYFKSRVHISTRMQCECKQGMQKWEKSWCGSVSWHSEPHSFMQWMFGERLNVIHLESVRQRKIHSQSDWYGCIFCLGERQTNHFLHVWGINLSLSQYRIISVQMWIG